MKTFLLLLFFSSFFLSSLPLFSPVFKKHPDSFTAGKKRKRKQDLRNSSDNNQKSSVKAFDDAVYFFLYTNYLFDI